MIKDNLILTNAHAVEYGSLIQASFYLNWNSSAYSFEINALAVVVGEETPH